MSTKQQAPRVFTWMVIWRSPYTPRPEGFPEVALSIDLERPPGAGAGPCPAEIDECWQEMREYGYCVSVHLNYVPARQLPLASKQRIRRRNLWKRLLKKYPMFVSDWYAEQVQSRPDYYGDFVRGEFADVVFYRTTMGSLKMASRAQLEAA